MKIVINTCSGGFGLSDKAMDLYLKYSERLKSTTSESDIERNDPNLIKVIEELGDKANGLHAELKIIEIPEGVKCRIIEYDGNEQVVEVHRTWS